jgi:hypothetical protein
MERSADNDCSFDGLKYDDLVKTQKIRRTPSMARERVMRPEEGTNVENSLSGPARGVEF